MVWTGYFDGINESSITDYGRFVTYPWSNWLSPYHGLSTDRFSRHSPLLLPIILVLSSIVWCCIFYAWIHQHINQLMLISTDLSPLRQVFTRRNEPFSQESVVEILRFLMKFTVFLRTTQNGEFYEKRRIQSWSSRENSSLSSEIIRFSYIRRKTEYLNDKTENFIIHLNQVK